MICLKLFWTFLKIGLFTIGGGYAMIPMIEDEVVGSGWITGEELLDFIGIAESTPGPFAINIATFVGWTQSGVLGALCATFGVVLPSFVIILLISAVLKKILDNRGVQGFFYGVRPIVTGLILSSAISVFFSIVLPLTNLVMLKKISFQGFDYVSLILIVLFLILSLLRFKDKDGKRKKSIHPMIIVGLSVITGIVLFGVIGL